MKDREFLMWLHERLENVHNEHPQYDYMHKFRVIISEYPSEKITSNHLYSNSLEELKEKLEE